MRINTCKRIISGQYRVPWENVCLPGVVGVSVCVGCSWIPSNFELPLLTCEGSDGEETDRCAGRHKCVENRADLCKVAD